MSVLRQATTRCSRPLVACRKRVSLPRTSVQAVPSLPSLQAHCRTYAKRKSTVKSTDTLVPGSQQPITDPAAQAEYEKCTEKMSASFKWFQKECAGLETRATGRVTPALLDPVRVSLGSGGSARLNEVATVGVRSGTILTITAFDETTLKSIETGIWDAKIPNVSPQRQDARTLIVPVPKPTVDSRVALYNVAHRQAEETRVQIRKHHQASVKRGKYEKHSIELEEFQKLNDRFIADIDKTLAELKKVTQKK
ncbi:hypothetical protein PLICRDRAFT_105335 [Plicaturopsis crispa FD-325 SS-3]|nr:hypothetical protein PLICRDRAFT_105335 [Plicaturopsis crispa FD-325 SS-3]